MIKKTVLYGAVLTLGLFTSQQAHAVTIGDVAFEEVLSFEVPGTGAAREIGYWRHMNKFYTYKKTAIDVTNSELAGVSGGEFDTFVLSGMTTHRREETDLASANFTFYNQQGGSLLTGSLLSDGFLDVNRGRGTIGQFNVTGLFSVTGGSLGNQGLFGDTLYVEFLFDRVTSNGTKDYYGHLGQVRIFTAGGGETPPGQPVPEPASMILLLSGLLGAKRGFKSQE